MRAVSGLTLAEALERLATAGFDGNFAVVGGEGTIRCDKCGATVPPDRVEVLELYRIEGESDPADEAVVAGVRCGQCGARGVLVATYGPMADPADADVVVALMDSRET
jgi:hypothetical protein